MPARAVLTSDGNGKGHKKTGAEAPVAAFSGSRGWFDPTRARGRGAWGYELVPDRTVSGNGGKLGGHWGVSADKKRRECGGTSPIVSFCNKL
jgi:hypothetical protein